MNEHLATSGFLTTLFAMVPGKGEAAQNAEHVQDERDRVSDGRKDLVRDELIDTLEGHKPRYEVGAHEGDQPTLADFLNQTH